MKKIIGYFATILTFLSFTGCKKNYPLKNFEYYINESKLTESEFSNQSEPESPLREKFYTIDFPETENKRDGSLRIISRINRKSLVSITLIEERNIEENNLKPKKTLSVPIETLSEECDYQSENAIVRKLLEKAKNYRLSEDYSKKAKIKIEMLIKNP